MAGKQIRPIELKSELARLYAGRCESLAGTLQAAAVLGESIYILKDPSKVFAEIERLESRIRESMRLLAEGKPIGPESVAPNAQIKRKKR